MTTTWRTIANTKSVMWRQIVLPLLRCKNRASYGVVPASQVCVCGSARFFVSPVLHCLELSLLIGSLIDPSKAAQGQLLQRQHITPVIYYFLQFLKFFICITIRVAPDIISGPGRKPAKFSYPVISGRGHRGRIWPPNMRPDTRSDLTIFRCICLTV